MRACSHPLVSLTPQTWQLVLRQLLVGTTQAALGMNIEASGSAKVRIGSK